MSRIGKQPVKLPDDVKVSISVGLVNVEGPRGSLVLSLARGVQVNATGRILQVSLIDVGGAKYDKAMKANFGTTRALLNTMVIGVTKGWRRSLEISGIGYTASVKGSDLMLAAGYSHDVKIEIPNGVKITVEKNIISLESNDRNLLGLMAAKIRQVRPPEPYLGKGIKYSGETIRRKAGKAAKKAA